MCESFVFQLIKHTCFYSQTLVLSSISPVDREESLTGQNIPLDRDITFTKPGTNHAVTGDLDVTQGRHHVNQNELIVKLKKILDEAADYLKENHMEMKPPEWKHGQALNRILHIMGFMSVESLEKVYHDLVNSKEANKYVH